MKKFLILLSLLFVTVCYAAPPPDDGNILAFETEMVTMQDETAIVDVAVYNMQRIEAQEVAFTYIGNAELFTGAEIDMNENAATLRFAEMPVIWVDIQLIALNKPPSFAFQNNEVNMPDALRNKQHTNYGYPLTANKVSRVA